MTYSYVMYDCHVIKPCIHLVANFYPRSSAVHFGDNASMKSDLLYFHVSNLNDFIAIRFGNFQYILKYTMVEHVNTDFLLIVQDPGMFT